MSEDPDPILLRVLDQLELAREALRASDRPDADGLRARLTAAIQEAELLAWGSHRAEPARVAGERR